MICMNCEKTIGRRGERSGWEGEEEGRRQINQPLIADAPPALSRCGHASSRSPPWISRAGSASCSFCELPEPLGTSLHRQALSRPSPPLLRNVRVELTSTSGFLSFWFVLLLLFCWFFLRSFAVRFASQFPAPRRFHHQRLTAWISNSAGYH